jgi:hypothetical protein
VLRRFPQIHLAWDLLRKMAVVKFRSVFLLAVEIMTLLKFSRKKAILHQLMVLLPLWWGGLDCLAACSLETSGMPAEQNCVSAANEHACCITIAPSEGFGIRPLPAPAHNECPALKELQANLPTKQTHSAKRDVALASLAAVPPAATKTVAVAWQLPHARWLDGQDTYLHCCVFLI